MMVWALRVWVRWLEVWRWRRRSARHRAITISTASEVSILKSFSTMAMTCPAAGAGAGVEDMDAERKEETKRANRENESASGCLVMGTDCRNKGRNAGTPLLWINNVFIVEIGEVWQGPATA